MDPGAGSMDGKAPAACSGRLMRGLYIAVLVGIGAVAALVGRANVPTGHINLNGPHLRLADGHPNPRGHAHFAAQIAALLHPRPAGSP